MNSTESDGATLMVDSPAADPGPASSRRFDITGESVVTWVVVALCCGFVFYSLHPNLILVNTTPTGGDMGAHVWGPRFLRDALIPAFRLAGWTQDWYAGFPAYLFYMVVPSLMIVWLSTSPPLWLVPFLFVALGVAVAKGIPRITTPWIRRSALVASVLLAVLFLPVPYNIAFKLVTISGLLTLPIAACALAKALRAPFPVPPLVALATLPFIYDRGFTILGGNGASTMAGEFAFSISLTFALFYLAALFAGARTGRWRATGAILLALTVLCHIIPAIFAVVVTIVVVPFLRREPIERPDPAAAPPDDVLLEDGASDDVVRDDTSGRDDTDVDASAPDTIEPGAQRGPHEHPAAVPSSAEVDEGQPWWAADRRGSIVSTLIVMALVVLVLIDRSWLKDTADHDPLRGGIAHWQFLLPALGSIAAVLFFTGFSPRFARRVTDRTGSLVAVALTIGLGVLLIVRPSNWGVVLALLILGFVYFVEVDRASVRWTAAVAPVAALLTGFWMLPFLAGSTYMNDMGWEKYTTYWDYLLAVPELDSGGMALRSAVFVAVGIGVILSIIMKVRLGWFLSLVAVVFAWMFRYFPQYRLWNARLLPFYFLALYMLAGLGGALVIRFASEVVGGPGSGGRARRVVQWVGVAVAVIVVLGGLLGSFKALPGGKVVPGPEGSKSSLYRWAGIDIPLGLVPDWAAWNYSGVERKPAYPEFSGLIDMMDEIGRDEGCGRAFWEFDSELNRFGTTMSLMMLPYYTDGCITSMEGLYFEASTTTPFHFLMQSALSTSPSRPQREMPYPNFDIDLGVRQMQMLGVRYYMASSEQAINAAETEPRLEKLAEKTFTTEATEPRRWVVFRVRDVKLAEGLENVPVVLENANDHIDGWVYDEKRSEPTPDQAAVGKPGSKTAGPAVEWFMNPARWYVFLATSGPSDWPRASADDALSHAEPLPMVTITDLVMDDGMISFDVDRVGVPVLVRESYFPNWRASGATGPYRVTPNFMVVVPTEKHVVLTYGRSAAEIAGAGMTIAGIAGVIGLAVLDDRRRRAQIALAATDGSIVDTHVETDTVTG